MRQPGITRGIRATDGNRTAGIIMAALVFALWSPAGAPRARASGAYSAGVHAPGHGAPVLAEAGPIQIGGEFSLKLDYYTGYPPGAIQGSSDGEGSSAGEGRQDAPGKQDSPMGGDSPEGQSGLQAAQPVRPPIQESWRPGIQQDLRLYIAVETSARSDVYVSLSSGGVWGVQFPSDGSYGMNPTFGPLLIDEANFRYVLHDFAVTAGRLYAQMGPIGLICSSPLSPFEGALVDVRTGNVEISALYSRLSSQYKPYTYMVVGGDELLALRLAARAGQWILGYNYLYTGLVDERAQSIDFQGTVSGREIKGELAFARPPTTFAPEFNHGWVPGWVFSSDIIRSNTRRLTVTIGSLAKGFTPTYSSSASAGGEELGFYENTRGIRVSYTRNLSPTTVLKVSATGLAFNDPRDAMDKGVYERIPTRRLDFDVIHSLSSSSQISLGYSSFHNDRAGYGRLRASYSVSF
ncbi:MAG TPA: hypothetical protein GX506_03135 [Firmicutes bacterium]|nr:hypothetical protein [Bacillota bacterium]